MMEVIKQMKTARKSEEKKCDSDSINNVEFERLQAFSKKNKMTMSDVMVLFNKAKASLVEKQLPTDDRMVVNVIMNEARRIKQRQNFSKNKKKSETTTVYGFVVGTRGIWDKADTIRRAAKKVIEKEGMEAAKEQGFINGDNQILDKRDKIYGRPNPNVGKPLPENLHVLDLILYGFFRHNGSKDYKFTTLQTSDNRLARGWDKDIVQKGRYYTPAQITVIIDQELADEMTLKSSSAEDTISQFKALDEKMDIKEVIDQALAERKVKKDKEEITVKEKWTPISGVERYYEMTKDAWDRKVFVKGVVTYVNVDRPDGIGRITMGLMNPDNEEDTIRVRINPQTTDINFGELSEVYVMGKPERSKYKDQEAGGALVDGDVVIDAFAIYPVVKTPRSGGSAENFPEEGQVVDGWLE